MQAIPKYIFTAIFSICVLIISALIIYDAFPGTVREIRGTYRPLTQPFEPSYLYRTSENSVHYRFRFQRYLRNAYSDIQVFLQKREARNFNIIKDENGFLYTGNFYRSLDDELMSYAKRVVRLKEAASASGAPVLFVAAPDRYDYGKAPVRKGYPVDVISPRNMDNLLLNLYFLQIDTLDLRYSDMASWPQQDLFYRTDPHWTTQAAFEGFRVIVGELEQKYGLMLDPQKFYRNPENYTAITYPKSFLGSMGSSVGIPFSGGFDDFSVVLPNFDTSFQVHSGAWQKVGRFEGSIINLVYLERLDPVDNNPLNVYLEGDHSTHKIKNNTAADAPRMLIIGDSFFTPVAAYLASVCSEVTMLSISAGETADIERHVLDGNYDCIVIACSPTSIEDGAFPYFKS